MRRSTGPWARCWRALALGVSACGSSSSNTASSSLPTSIGAGEGQLNLVAWEGYAQPEWVKPFEKQTGCVVHAKYAGSSDEMVTLMRQGGGNQYDMVSASGDASLRLIRGGDVAADERRAGARMEELHPAAAVAAAQHGQRRALRHLAAVGPEHRCSTTRSRSSRRRRAGQRSTARSTRASHASRTTRSRSPTRRCTCPRPDRASASPTPTSSPKRSSNAAVKLLKEQHPLIKKYWALASDEIELFKNGDAVIGAAWPYQHNTLVADKAPVARLIPVEGATGLGRHVDALRARHSTRTAPTNG